ncbi:MAG: hypothetical protein EOS70_27995 [Mesorhizobium sp.]|uniref:hypothetical protein n=1 Tax=Mesorhizobium sp. TaxID=1871066 RepID=UPI000FE7CCFE|nr:hypothetical protein [Mesorhizobium sp.]RWC28156.1 MAG: hypothetical protein EOS70_27995 [Mesorhizobium sp.]
MNNVMARETRRLARITASEDPETPAPATTKPKAGKDAVAEPGAEDDDEDADEQPKPKKTKAKVAVEEDAEAGASAAAAERRRCAGLAGLSAQADRLGVSFDASEAIAKGVSVDAARTAILDAAADGDAEETTAIASPKNKADKGGKSLDADAKTAAWKKAMKRR